MEALYLVELECGGVGARSHEASQAGRYQRGVN
jgi:hypothetical protein